MNEIFEISSIKILMLLPVRSYHYFHGSSIWILNQESVWENVNIFNLLEYPGSSNSNHPGHHQPQHKSKNFLRQPYLYFCVSTLFGPRQDRFLWCFTYTRATHCEHNTEHIYQDMELRTQVFGHNGSRIRFHDYIQSHMLSQIYILSQSIAAAGGNSHLHSAIWQSHPHPGSCDWYPQSMRSCPHAAWMFLLCSCSIPIVASTNSMEPGHPMPNINASSSAPVRSV